MSRFLPIQPLTIPRSLIRIKASTRGRAAVARRAHNPEVAGSNPAPATQVAEKATFCFPDILFPPKLCYTVRNICRR